MRRFAAIAVAALLSSPLAGCIQHNVISTIPPGLDPVEANTAPDPAPTATDPHPEVLSVVSGDTDEFSFAQAKGFIHTTMAKYYDAIHDGAVVTDRRRVDSFTVTNNVETGYDVSFRLHDVINNIITIDFDVTWRAGVVDGTQADPKQVNMRGGKTAGSSLVEVLEESEEAHYIDDNTIEVGLIRHAKGVSVSSKDVVQYVNDCYASIKAKVNGQPLPTWK
jgi:hypothetical protein